MSYNILVSCPLEIHLTTRVGDYYYYYIERYYFTDIIYAIAEDTLLYMKQDN